MGDLRRHLPRAAWTDEALAAWSWTRLAEVARYPWRGSKKAAKKRIHKLNRARSRGEMRRT